MQNFDVSSLINIPVVGICFVVGYLIKNSIPKIPNKCIPPLVTVVGAIIGAVISAINGDASISAIGDGFISGAISGLASTGSYEFIVNIFGLKNKKEDSVITEESEEESEDDVEETEDDTTDSDE